MEISAANQLLTRIRKKNVDTKYLTGNLKINYDRAIELRKQVAREKVLNSQVNLAGNQLLSKINKNIDPSTLTGDEKINYDRAIELRKQSSDKLILKRAEKQVKKLNTLATKKGKEFRRDSSLSQAATSAGSPNPETKAQKQARIKAEKIAAIGGSI